MFDQEWPEHPLVRSQTADVDDPEENLEQGDVHVVVVTIVDEATIGVLHQHKSGQMYQQVLQVKKERKQ